MGFPQKQRCAVSRSFTQRGSVPRICSRADHSVGLAWPGLGVSLLRMKTSFWVAVTKRDCIGSGGMTSADFEEERLKRAPFGRDTTVSSLQTLHCTLHCTFLCLIHQLREMMQFVCNWEIRSGDCPLPGWKVSKYC